MCPHTTDTLSLELTMPDGTTLACGQSTDKIEIAAVVLASTPTSLSLDLCPPNYGCPMMKASLEVHAAGLSIGIPTGALLSIQIDVWTPPGGGCMQAVLVQNLPTWSGVPNPASTESFLWFTGTDGGATTFYEAPFSVTAMPDCNDEPGAPYENQELTFTSAMMPPSPTPPQVTVPMGASAVWTVAPQETWVVHNLRSFTTAPSPPGGYQDIAFWIQRSTSGG
jgi:hypothetical protein